MIFFRSSASAPRRSCCKGRAQRAWERVRGLHGAARGRPCPEVHRMRRACARESSSTPAGRAPPLHLPQRLVVGVALLRHVCQLARPLEGRGGTEHEVERVQAQPQARLHGAGAGGDERRLGPRRLALGAGGWRARRRAIGRAAAGGSAGTCACVRHGRDAVLPHSEGRIPSSAAPSHTPLARSMRSWIVVLGLLLLGLSACRSVAARERMAAGGSRACHAHGGASKRAPRMGAAAARRHRPPGRARARTPAAAERRAPRATHLGALQLRQPRARRPVWAAHRSGARRAGAARRSAWRLAPPLRSAARAAGAARASRALVSLLPGSRARRRGPRRAARGAGLANERGGRKRGAGGSPAAAAVVKMCP
jgi:hypothetical protein